MPEPDEVTKAKKPAARARKPAVKARKPARKAVARAPAIKKKSGARKPLKRASAAKKAAKKVAPKQNVVVVGKGLVGTALYKNVIGHWLTRRKVSGRLVAGRVVTRRKVSRTSPKVIWVLAVPAAAVDPVLQSLLPSLAKGDVVLHTAPTLSAEALSAARAHGASVGVLIPVARVLSKSGSWWSSPLRAAPFFFEGDAKARPAAQLFARASFGTLLNADRADPARSHAVMQASVTALVQALCDALDQVQRDASRTMTLKETAQAADGLMKGIQQALKKLGPHDLLSAIKATTSPTPA